MATSKLNLEDFAKTYISCALSLARKCPTPEEFDNKLSKKMSALTGIKEGKINQIHHPFYWVLFEDETILENGFPMKYSITRPSLLELIEIDGQNRIFVKNKINIPSFKKYAINKLITEYGEYVLATYKPHN